MDKLTIILVLRSGGDFHFSDVELLSYHLKRWNPDAQIICLNDKVDHVYDLQYLKVVPIENKDWPGWWSKMNLFSPELEKYRPFLYMDLDTAVVGSLPIPENKEQFITLEDFYRKETLASGMMWVPADSEKVKKVWAIWNKQPYSLISRFRGDGEFIRSAVKADCFWQQITDKITSFKPQLGKGWLKELPTDKSVICFHGFPRIPKAAETVEWVKQYVKEAE